jgi:subfamily B ATP-binding cassette protein MsbA
MKNTITKFIIFLKPYWKKGLWAFILMLLSTTLQLPMPFLTKYLIDKVIYTKSLNLLHIIGLIIVGVLVLRAFSTFVQNFLFATFKGRVLFDIRTRLFDHIQRASLGYFHSNDTGYLMSRLSDDVNSLEGLLAENLVIGVQNILLFIGGAAAALYIHPGLAVICFLMLPLYLLSLAVFNKRIRRLSLQTREQYAFILSDLQELLSGIAVIKSFTAEGLANLRMARAVKRAVKSEIKLDVMAAFSSIISLLISAAGPIMVLWYGCSEIMSGNLTVGGLFAFMSFTAYLFGPVRILYDLNTGFQRSLPAVERIFEMFDTKSEPSRGKPLAIKAGKVAFSGVCFGYSDDRSVLEDLNLTLEPQSNTALIGRSGAGKSTVALLLLRFYQPGKGRISIDGADISEVDLKDLRRNIGWVSQDTFLFSDTIRENIRFGRPDASDEDVERAARAAFAHDFIIQLPGGYDTAVGERGCTLSGGQRQRIAIARALIKDPAVLIMDEATSQLDMQSEQTIGAAIKGLSSRKTVLVIAHRPSTIRQADRIVLLDRGRIAAEGTHDQLFNSNSVYRGLYTALEGENV